MPSVPKADRPIDRSGDAATTRSKVIESAVHCILELGFYRASSNAIARQAGVTWGVIQHHFGTRERLMVEVLEDGAQRFIATMANAPVIEGTPEQRFELLIDLLCQHYGQPEYLAYHQILLNLDHDPRTSAAIRETMRDVAKQSNAHLLRLLRQTLGDDHRLDDVMFLAIRGVILGQQLRAALSYDTTARRYNIQRERKQLAAILASYLDRQSPTDRA